MSPDLKNDTTDGIQLFKDKIIAHANHLRGRGGEKLRLESVKLTRIIIENFLFTDATIISTEFSFSSFAGSKFTGAQLRNSLFSHCNMSGCDFSNADMQALSIIHSNLTQSRMASARSAEAFFTFDPTGEYKIDFKTAQAKSMSTDFSNSNFSGADLSGAQLAGGKFTGANLAGAKLDGADITGADFSAANLVGISLEGAKIENATFSDAAFSLDDKTRQKLGNLPAFLAFAKGQDEIVEDLRNHELWALSDGKEGLKAIFKEKVLKGGDFRFRTLSAIDFSKSDLRACLFNDSVIAASDFSNTKASYCNFSEADARGIRLENARFSFCSFVDADFTPLSIKGVAAGLPSRFGGAVFTNCDLSRAKLTPELLKQAKFVNCKRD